MTGNTCSVQLERMELKDDPAAGGFHDSWHHLVR
jgi:hypothetical protein